MAPEEDTVARNNVAGLEENDIANDKFLEGMSRVSAIQDENGHAP